MGKRTHLIAGLAAIVTSACQQDPSVQVAKTAENRCLRSNGAPNWKPSEGQTIAQFCADWGDYQKWRYIAAHDPKRFERTREELKRTLNDLDGKKGGRPQ